ncbi:MAG: hypothetical protein FWH07_02140 [Oscillospiraceae bacterium]|nr:hypothetical protein [Oscillospiraceae bacterium]
MPNKGRFKADYDHDSDFGHPKSPTLQPTFIILVIAIAVVVVMICTLLYLFFSDSFSGEGENAILDLQEIDAPPPQGAIVADPELNEIFPDSEVSDVSTQAEKTLERNEETAFEQTAFAYTDGYEPGFFIGTLFIGDSIFTGIDAYRFMPSDNVFARVGISAFDAVTAEINGKTLFGETGIAADFNRAVIMIGTNGLNGMNSVDVAYDVFALAAELKVARTDMEVVVLTAPPVFEENEYGLTMETISGFNAALVELSAGRDIVIVDYSSVLRNPEGYLNPQYAQPDGVHLRQAAYEIMFSLLQSNLEAAT